MSDKTLAALTAATPATGGLFYGTESGADRKFTLSAAGAALIEATTTAEQRTALSAASLGVNAFTGANSISVGGAANMPAFSLTGTWLTGGSTTTNKPQLLIEPSSQSVSNRWSVNGTGLGINAPDGFTGDLINCLMGINSVFRIVFDQPSGSLAFGTAGSEIAFYGGQMYPATPDTMSLGRPGVSSWTGLILTPAAPINWNSDSYISRSAAASFQLGLTHATTPTAQLIKAHDVTTGTGANLVLSGGTGSSANGVVKIANGKLNLAGIPTSAAGLTTGDVYSNAGILTIV